MFVDMKKMYGDRNINYINVRPYEQKNMFGKIYVSYIFFMADL